VTFSSAKVFMMSKTNTNPRKLAYVVETPPHVLGEPILQGFSCGVPAPQVQRTSIVWFAVCSPVVLLEIIYVGDYTEKHKGHSIPGERKQD